MEIWEWERQKIYRHSRLCFSFTCVQMQWDNFIFVGFFSVLVVGFRTTSLFHFKMKMNEEKATTTSWAVPDFKVTLPQYGKSSARQFVSLEKSRQLFSLSNAWKRNTSTRPSHTELHRSMNGNGQPVSQKWSGSVLLRDLISLDLAIPFQSLSPQFLSLLSQALSSECIKSCKTTKMNFNSYASKFS